jgi:hypothetical protein
MSSPIQTPYGANLLSALLVNTALTINPTTSNLVGTSHTVSSYTPGTLVTETCLTKLVDAIKAGYTTLGVNLDVATYSNLIAIGSSSIPALGNSKPPTYTWIGPANTGDSTSTAAQEKSWYPYTATATTNTYPSTNPTPRQWSDLTSSSYTPDITQYGWIRLFALQAWNEFNYNNDPTASIVYKDFVGSFQTCIGFMEDSNSTVSTLTNSLTFLKNTYSNNNDLMTADVTGVNLATTAFGQDLINTGKIINLAMIEKFGLPSTLLLTLNKYNAVTNSLSYALLSSGLSVNDITGILNGTIVPTTVQEKQIYGSFTVIVAKDLEAILIPLNVNIKNLDSLADLLDIKKLFPTSYQSMTVPIYNTAPGPTNAKTYYQIYVNGGLNSQLTGTQVVEAVGSAGVAPESVVIPESVPAYARTTPSTRTSGVRLGLDKFKVVREYQDVNDDNGNTQGLTSIEVNTAQPTPSTTPNYQPVAMGYGSYSRGTVPDEISISTGAFSYSMQQITNIKNIPIEKFAQIVANLETTAGLPLTAGTDVPTNTTLASLGLDQLTYGSGPDGTFRVTDFFGAMSGLPYQWTDVKNCIKQLETNTLKTIYANIYTTISTAVGDVSATVQTYIDSANAEIASIKNSNPVTASLVNKMWNLTGTQLTIEQRARDMALVPVTVPRTNRLANFPQTTISYVNSFTSYANKTEPCMHSQVIEAISDLTLEGGQSQVALLRLLRNTKKLNDAGIPTEYIPSTWSPLTSKILMGNGTVSTAVNGVPAGDATFTIPADSNVIKNSNTIDGTSAAIPIGHFENDKNDYCQPTDMYPTTVLGTIPDNAYVGQDLAGPNITQVNDVIIPIAGGYAPQGECNIINLGSPIVPGSLAGNPYQNLIPPQLSVPFMSGILSTPTYTVADAIDEVVRCNCDCWLE